MRLLRLVIIGFALMFAVVTFGAATAQELPDALGSVSGTVRNQQGEPLPGIEVYMTHYTYAYPSRFATTNAQGEYRFLSVQPGAYRLLFSDHSESYASTYYPDGAFPDEAQLVNVQGSAVSGVDVTLSEGGSLAVEIEVSGSLTDTLISYVSATLARQNQNGRWEPYKSAYQEQEALLFRAVPSGEYRLCANVWNYVTYQVMLECYNNILPPAQGDFPDLAEKIAIANGTHTTITMTMGDIHQLTGVLQSPEGEPIAGAYVEITSPSVGLRFNATSDAQGRWRFTYIPTGDYHLMFRATGYLSTYYNQAYNENQATRLHIDSDSRINLTTTMRPSAQIVGTLLMADGGPVDYSYPLLERYLPESDSWSPLWFCDAPDCVSYAYLSTTGVYTISNLLPGSYRLAMWVPLPETEPKVVEVLLGEGETRTNVNFVFGVGAFEGKIMGTVTANGLPQAGIEVGVFYYMMQMQLPFAFTHTDAQGKYELKGLTRGTYQVGFRDPLGQYAITFFDNQPFDRDSTSVVISDSLTVANVNAALTAGATIRGRVHNESRRTAGGYRILVYTWDGYFNMAYLDVYTDAQGTYEIKGLPPGSYLILAVKPYETPIIAPEQYQMYYPNALWPESAGKVIVEAGQEVAGIDIWFDATPGALLPYIGSQRSGDQ